MKIIETIADASALDLPDSVKTELLHQLIASFETAEEAEAFWQEQNCFLIVLEPADTIEQLEEHDRENGNWLDFITTYPEEVVIIGDEEFYLLALAIFADSGSGGYLLVPLSHHSSYKAKLKAHINNH
ncbi:TPA: hypothetical protein NJ353_004104 [Vibrio parahaemolyticus]|nr:hypothetical protein [Vibrio parahaemolyticus]HCG7083620.1 hypothetical protein [Vibrio parahaemolyticus]HCH0725466.1 hypothetical protein [Vibrio parahaemolyticus]HCH1053912.1 hypothetical protein [Vibrio parahaemolyticus]HCH5614481.1 hypothetical protein [Vibrio parahaemolyticus]